MIGIKAFLVQILVVAVDGYLGLSPARSTTSLTAISRRTVIALLLRCKLTAPSAITLPETDR